jgi:hypothetical protein
MNGYLKTCNPAGLKQKVTFEDRLPHSKVTDFEISTNDIENCEGLLAVCKKGK